LIERASPSTLNVSPGQVTGTVRSQMDRFTLSLAGHTVPPELVIAGAIVVVALVAALSHLVRRRRRARRDAAVLEEKRRLGQHLARSLHPVIDPDICIGSLSCLKACPEGDILGVVGSAARLVHADHCIGHGRCAAECPVGAIKLVFGSAERGVDLPEVNEVFESSRRGVHVVGELGGMGLIKNAITQGLQVAEHLAGAVPRGGPGVLIVGAGPAGIATALGLKARRIPFRLVDQGTMGGSVAHYPRRKIAMTEAVELPLWGRFGKSTISKEELLKGWTRILAKTGIKVEEGVKVTAIEGSDQRFQIATEGGPVLPANKVVLAIGRRGTPRKLGVPGEESDKVVYGLTDPEQYEGERVLVVGGGDAALEAAIQVAEETDADVALSYRGAELARCREANREKFGRLVRAGRIEALLPSQVKEIRPREVVLEVNGRLVKHPNDFVIVCIGGELPVDFLGKVGVAMRRYHGEAPAHVHVDGVADRRRAATSKAARRAQLRRRVLRTLYVLVGLSILAYLSWKGRNYYLLSRAEQRHSPLYATMRSAGSWGHMVGIVATAFLLSNFLYAARKRWKRLGALGSIKGWLDFHVFVGILSPCVIGFHAAFQSKNLFASATAASLAIVVATGLIGRFIYSAVPSDGGKAVELADLLGRFERLRGEQSNALAMAGPRAQRVFQRATAPVHAGSMALLFVLMPLEALALRLRLTLLRGRFKRRMGYLDFRNAIIALARIRWQIRFYQSLKRLLRGWRAFHASLAVFLVLAIAAHIGVSLYFGYGLLGWTR
jgi:thioredoxin reductase/Pyruvate/2-oxoacid:ferredoxin oxidoreductase delta subunit